MKNILLGIYVLLRNKVLKVKNLHYSDFKQHILYHFYNYINVNIYHACYPNCIELQYLQKSVIFLTQSDILNDLWRLSPHENSLQFT